MRYFPGYCDGCRRSFLKPGDAPDVAPACPRCAEPGRLIPGAYYAESDERLFASVESALHQARLAPAQVAALLGLLQRLADHGAPTLEDLRRALARISGLHRVEALVTNSAQSPLRVLGLFFSLLAPLVDGPSERSGTRLAHPAPELDRAGGDD